MTTHEELTPEDMAVKIVEHSNEADKKYAEADEHLLEAASLIVLARQQVEECSLNSWTEWWKQNIALSESRIRELCRIGWADDPRNELQLVRAETRERVARHREKKKAQLCETEDRRYVTAVEEETDEPREDSDSSSVPESAGDPDDTLASGSHPDQEPEKERLDDQAKKQKRRNAAQDRARFVEIGESIIAKKPNIASFKKISETPSEPGLVVLIAEVDSHRSTHVKCFVTEKDIINRALSVLGNGREIEAWDEDASSVASKRIQPIKEAVSDARSEGNSPASEAVT